MLQLFAQQEMGSSPKNKKSTTTLQALIGDDVLLVIGVTCSQWRVSHWFAARPLLHKNRNQTRSMNFIKVDKFIILICITKLLY